MKYCIAFLSLITILGCKSSENLELVILTNEINCLDILEGEYSDYIFGNKIVPTEAKTLIKYKIINNTSNKYYFNVKDINIVDNSKFDHYINIDKAYLSIEQKDGSLVKVRSRIVNESIEIDDENFTIQPRETLHFERSIILPFGTLQDKCNYSVILDKNFSYFAHLLISIDGRKFKRDISASKLKNIEANGYKIFNGTIKSKNKVPIIFHTVNN